jgi:2-oxoglutarate ferredoxin oxidoreductase subunit gamma
MAETIQVRMGGFGGQGIVLMGMILGDAAVRSGLWAAGSNSYGAQARGSACRSEVILSPDPVDFPHVLEADYLISMSQEAYERYRLALGPRGMIVYDDPLVRMDARESHPHYPVPATQRAVEELGSRQVANVVLLAATVALAEIVPRDALTAAVQQGVASRFKEVNMRALKMGFRLGEERRHA